MPSLSVNFEGDGCWPDILDKKIIHLGEGAPPLKIAVLDKGMTSGKPSVTIRLDLPDGSVVLAETSALLLVNAGRMIHAKYPELLEGN